MTASEKNGITSLRVLIPFTIVTLIWGSTWLVIRDQLGIVPASWSVTYRFIVAGVVMFIWAVMRGEKLWLGRAGIGFALLFGLPQFVLNFNFVYRSEMYITSGLVAVLFALLIVPNSVFGWLFLKQPITRRFLLGSLIGTVGVAMLFIHEIHVDMSDISGVILGISFALLAVLSASTANVLQATERAKSWPMATMLAWSMVLGAAINAIWAYSSAGPPVFDMRAGYIAGVLYLGIMASAVAFTLYFGVIRIIGPAKAAYSSVAVPVIAMILSTMFEGYRWSLLAGSGGILVLIGLVIALSARKPAR